MHGATRDEIKASFGAMGLKCEEYRVSFPGNDSSYIRIPLHVKEPHQLLFLARVVAHIGYEENHFLGAHFWLTGWGMWDPLVEAIGLKTMEQIRRCSGENRPIEVAPGLQFRSDEFVESVSCLLQPMLVGWDAYYVPSWAWGTLDYFVRVSHDSYIEIEVRTKEMRDRATSILQKVDWVARFLKS
jgi:hypothetical protein